MTMHENYLGFEHLYDARIRTEDGYEFPVHRVLVSVRCGYFHNILCNGSSSENSDILIPAISGATMEIILEYIYSSKLDPTGHDIGDILLAANFLEIDQLMESSRILALTNLTIKNSMSLFLAACRHSRLGIFRACFRFIQVNFESIVRYDGSRFQDIPVKSLEDLLASDSLNVSNERQVWRAIELWMNKLPGERIPHLKKLVSCIRFDEGDGLSLEILRHTFVTDNPNHIQIQESISNRNPVPKHRTPKMIFFCTKLYLNMSDFSNGIKIFITFDGNIDIWKQISSKVFCPDVVLHGLESLVVMFETMTNVIHTFDILSKTWSSLPSPVIPRINYSVVKLGTQMFVLGGVNPTGDGEEMVMDVEKYDFTSGRWELAKQHDAFAVDAAVAVDNRIYAVGAISDLYNDLLVAQAYIADTDCWQSITPPQFFRRQFALAVYQERLFIIGGHSSDGFSRSVEVYDADSDTWSPFQELPFPYLLPKTAFVQHALYVYDNHSGNYQDFRCPPVFLDNASHKWQVVEASSPFCDLHIYQFCAIENSAIFTEMKRENGDQVMMFEKSPFFIYLNTEKNAN